MSPGNNDGETDREGYEIDPDYKSTNTAIRNVELQEEDENELTENKLKTIIQDEFNKELLIRQKQIEEIEDKVFRAQKLLHIVRYVLISSYYNKKALEYESTESSTIDSNSFLLGQNRIHPAVKKLLGEDTNNLKFLTARTKRKAAVSKSELHTQIQPETKKIKLENKDIPSTSSPDTMKSDPTILNPPEELITNRKKIQHMLVIGNLSFYKKSLEQDNLTHRWMVYVKLFKGSKNGPEVTNVAVSKVTFFLHPSYKPHDVLEISQPPFHLSRRGWGEFPLRVRIHFNSQMNKPLEIIHQIKLDNTFTERQTLGNQTTAPIFLYEDWSHSSSKSEVSSYDTPQRLNNNYSYSNYTRSAPLLTHSESTANQLISSEPITVEPSTSYEHDYCYDDVIKTEDIESNLIKSIKDEFRAAELMEIKSEKLDGLLRDHSYSLSSDKEGQKVPKKPKSPIKQPYNELIYGLGPSYLDPLKSRVRTVRSRVLEKNGSSENTQSAVRILKTITGQSIRFLPESFNQLRMNNGSIISVKFLKSPTTSSKRKRIINSHTKLESVASSRNSLKALVRQEKYLLKLPNNQFKNMGEALSYLFKRLPLWSSEANNLDYKCAYPFMARCEEEFSSWNVGKKLAAEWSRARTIKRIVSGELYSESWTTKAIFMYGRSHSYSPSVASYRLFQNESPEKCQILSCYRGERPQNGCLSSIHNNEEINIISPVKPVIANTESTTSDPCMVITDSSPQCVFIKETALDVGVVLKPEVLVEGVLMNASERIIFEAVKCFAENLIRRARNHLICQQNYRDENSEITSKEVNLALNDRDEFHTIKAFTENKRTRDFFS